MQLKTKSLGNGSQANHGIVFRFDQQEARWLKTHLGPVKPKLTYIGTIGDGLTVWFEPRGIGLWPGAGDDLSLEGTIAAPHICAFNGEREPMVPRYQRITHLGKPAFLLDPLPAYDRDAEKNDKAEKANILFNPVLAFPSPHEPPAASPAPNIVSLAAMKPRQQAAPMPEPTQITYPEAIANLKASIELVNEQIAACGDDIVFALSEDRRQMRVIRRKIIIEELED